MPLLGLRTRSDKPIIIKKIWMLQPGRDRLVPRAPPPRSSRQTRFASRPLRLMPHVRTDLMPRTLPVPRAARCPRLVPRARVNEPSMGGSK